MGVKSYSQWGTYKSCPRKWKLSYIDGLPRSPAGPAAQRGTEIHESLENYMLKKSDVLHPDIHANYGLMFMNLRNDHGETAVPEQSFNFNKDWESQDFDEKEGHVRGFIDCALPAPDFVDNLEYKTGKVYDDHKYQRRLYGLASLLLYPEVERVRVRNIYVDQKKEEAEEFSRNEVDSLKAEWEDRFKEMDSDDTWIAKPQFACRWCDFSKYKGGPCEF